MTQQTQVLISKKAKNDLVSIRKNIIENYPLYLSQVETALFKVASNLKTYPEMYPKVGSKYFISKNYRKATFKMFLLFYIYRNSRVIVMRVIPTKLYKL